LHATETLHFLLQLVTLCRWLTFSSQIDLNRADLITPLSANTLPEKIVADCTPTSMRFLPQKGAKPVNSAWKSQNDRFYIFS
jgi:hypothetical protein